MPYVHDRSDVNINNLHHAMELVGEIPHVRVTLGADNITVTGSVNIASEIKINNTELQSIPVHLTDDPIAVTGAFWQTTQPVSLSALPSLAGGTATIGKVQQDGDWTVGVTGTFWQETQPVSLTSLPSLAGGSATIGKVQQDGDWTVKQGTTPWQVSKNANLNASDNPIFVAGNLTATVTGGTIETTVGGASSVSAFGEPFGLTITPVIQIDSIYGITSDVIQTYTNGANSNASSNSTEALFTVSCGTDTYGYGVLRSRRFIRYRPGQGALCRFTAAFTPNVNHTSQRAGLFNEENGIMIGWHDAGTGAKFGVMRATGGHAEIQQLVINSITTGVQTITITLNGVVFNNIAVNTTSPQLAATAIALRVGGFNGWLVDQVDNSIVFLCTTLGPKNGTYSITSTGTLSGTFTQRQAGVAQTEYWTYQQDFNVDKLGYVNPLTGTKDLNPSGMTLASQFLNVFQINYRWLGVGEIRYAIENQLNGQLVFFHREHYTNQNTLAHISNPSFKIGYVSYNLGTTSNASVTGVCFMGAIEGEIKQNELNRSCQSIKAGLSKDTCFHLLTIRNPYVTNGKSGALNGNFILNAKEIIIKNVSVGMQGNDPGILYVFYNASSLTTAHSYFSQPKDNGMVSTVDGTMDPIVDTAIIRFVTAINGASQYPMENIRLAVPPGDSISFAIQSTAALNRVSLAVVFSED